MGNEKLATAAHTIVRAYIVAGCPLGSDDVDHHEQPEGDEEAIQESDVAQRS